MSDYGKRGGTSATAGKRRRTFAATAPDGSPLKAGSFQLQGKPGPFQMSSFQHDGKWYAGSVFQVGEAPPHAQPRVANEHALLKGALVHLEATETTKKQ